jgi:hypothetical protein
MSFGDVSKVRVIMMTRGQEPGAICLSSFLFLSHLDLIPHFMEENQIISKREINHVLLKFVHTY